jgi:hypothetical protein
VYLIDGWKCNLILLTLEEVVNGGTMNNFTKVIVDNVLQYECHDLNFGFVTKAKAWKGAGRECNLGVTFTFLGVRESERE